VLLQHDEQGAERHVLEEAVLEAVELRGLDEGRRRAHLLVVADHKDLLAAQKRRQLADVRLRGFIHDHEVEGAEPAGQLLRHAPRRHDPAREAS
jgi:hypothetical protein